MPPPDSINEQDNKYIHTVSGSFPAESPLPDDVLRERYKVIGRVLIGLVALTVVVPLGIVAYHGFSFDRALFAQEAPDAPLLNSVALNKYGEMIIRWKGSTKAVDGYIIEKESASGQWNAALLFDSSTLIQQRDTSVALDNYYSARDRSPQMDVVNRYRVLAYNEYGTSSPSAILAAMGPEPQESVINLLPAIDADVISESDEELPIEQEEFIKPKAPAQVTATVEGSVVNIRWRVPLDVEHTIEIYRTIDGSKKLVGTTTQDALVFVDVPPPNSFISYQLVAVNTAGRAESQSTGLLQGPVKSLKDVVEKAPSFPIIKSIVVDGNTMVLEWRDTSNNESGFIIKRSAAGSGWISIGTVGPNVTRFVDEDPVYNTFSNYAVHAINQYGSASSGTSVVNGPKSYAD